MYSCRDMYMQARHTRLSIACCSCNHIGVAGTCMQARHSHLSIASCSCSQVKIYVQLQGHACRQGIPVCQFLVAVLVELARLFESAAMTFCYSLFVCLGLCVFVCVCVCVEPYLDWYTFILCTFAFCLSWFVCVCVCVCWALFRLIYIHIVTACICMLCLCACAYCLVNSSCVSWCVWLSLWVVYFDLMRTFVCYVYLCMCLRMQPKHTYIHTHTHDAHNHRLSDMLSTPLMRSSKFFS
jgi:hypothetical protein